ncbi:hypothetical protein D9M68_821960 [compost metagenome]
MVVDAVDHTDGPRGDEIAGAHPQPRTLHRRGGDIHGQARLDGDAQLAHGVDHALQGRTIGDPQVAVEVRGQAASGQARLDLRARAVHQHQAHAHAVQQHQVVDDIAEVRVSDPLAGQHHHEGAVPVGVDVRSSVAQPVDVVGHGSVSLS